MKKYILGFISLIVIAAFGVDKITPTNIINLYEPSGGGSDKIKIVSPALTSSWTWTFPTGAGTSGYVLSTDGSGASSWVNSLTSFSLASPVISSGTASTVPYLDASKILVSSAVTPTQLGYLSGSNGTTGTNKLVFDTSPTLVTPTLGAATATSINSTTIPTSKTLVVTTDKLSALSSTTSAELAGVVSDETGSGALVYGTSPTIATPSTDVVTLDGQASTPANPSSGFYKAYIKDSTQKLTILNSSGTETTVGSGSGSINYITNGDGEAGTTGWSVYADTPGTSPVDGTGGSATYTELTATTTTPIRGAKSLLITKGFSSSAQGEGISYDFTIDKGDKGKVLQISFDYFIFSGAGTYTDDQLRVWVYYVNGASSKLIPVAPYLIKNHQNDSEKWFGEFQTEGGASAATTYRLIVHIGGTSSVDYQVALDNIVLGPQAKLYGSPVTDWVSYTPAGSWTANSPVYTGQWRKVGDSMELIAKVVCGGAPTSANLTINLPSGFTIDSTKLNTNQPLGTSYAEDSGVLGYDGFVRYNTTTSVQVVLILASGTYGSGTPVTQAVPFTFGANDFVIINIKVPILGWSSSQVMSSDADTRVVSLTALRTGSSITATAGAETEIVFDTIETNGDTGGNYSTTTGRFTASTPGWYRYSANTLATMGAIAPTNFNYYAKKNGTGSFLGTAYSDNLTANKSISFYTTDKIYLNAGDYFSIWANPTGQNVTIGNHASNHNTSLTVERISGPSQIMQSESIDARASGDAASASVGNPVIFPTADWSTHGAYSTTTGLFTCPTSGKVLVSGWITSANANITINIAKDGATDVAGGITDSNGEGVFSGVSRCLSGQTLSIEPSGTLDAGSGSWIYFQKIGNY